MPARDVEIWTLVFEGVKTVGVVAAAAWAFWRFRRERSDAPQMGFTVDARLFGPSKGACAAEYVLTFENKGKTRVEVSRIGLSVRGIKKDEGLTYWEGREPRLFFPHKLVDDGKIVSARDEYFFFEPGIKQEIKYLSIVPAEIDLLLINGRFYYANNDRHTAERVIDVKAAVHEVSDKTHEVERNAQTQQNAQSVRSPTFVAFVAFTA